MIKVDSKKDCCGCNACVQICPKACIEMKEDNEGFCYPKINTDKCIGCNLCEKACPIIQKPFLYVSDDKKRPRTIGGWHKNEEVRYDSSSGGAFSLFAEYILKLGGVVYGCALKDFRAEHIGVEHIEDLEKLRGSKYIQSDTATAYNEIKANLENNQKVLFVGTPCQCAGLQSFLGKNDKNLYMCDFICHGVPSPKVFKSYIELLEKKYHDKVVSFRFRNKDKGWNSTGLQLGTRIGFLHIGYKRLAPAFKDSFMNGFLDDVYLRPSCYNCEFKCLPKYYSDITIADFWGVKEVDMELYDGKGTSLLLIHNGHGEELFNLTKDNFFYKDVDYEAAIYRNKSLIQSVTENPYRTSFFKDYVNKPFIKVKRKYMSAFGWAFHKAKKIVKSMRKNN